MKHKKIVIMIIFVEILGIVILGASVFGQTKPRGGVNLVKEEMAVLDPAFKKVINVVVLGNMEIIKPALDDLREAREEVEKAIKAGQKIPLPKN